MKTMHQTKECSVAIAFAELGRLERDRAELATTKQALRAAARRQAQELAELRERFEAERPRAFARVRRERLRREQARAQLEARLRAEAEAAHAERLALLRTELEAKRLRLAAVEAAEELPTHPGRRLLEWSSPVAATTLVALLGLTVFGEDEAVARTAIEQRIPAPEPEPEFDFPVVPYAPALAPAPEPEPEQTKRKRPTRKPATSKPTRTKPKADKREAKPDRKPLIKKNSNPLKLGGFDGNPLG